MRSIQRYAFWTMVVSFFWTAATMSNPDDYWGMGVLLVSLHVWAILFAATLGEDIGKQVRGHIHKRDQRSQQIANDTHYIANSLRRVQGHKSVPLVTDEQRQRAARLARGRS